MRQNANYLNSECNTSYKSIKFIFTTHAHFQIVLTCMSDMIMIGIAEEKFYSHAAVFTTSLAKIGELSLWKQKLSKFLQYFEKMSCLLYEQLCQNFNIYQLLSLSTGCKAVRFLPQLSKLLYQLVHSILLRDGKYSFQEHSYVHSRTKLLLFFCPFYGAWVGGEGVRND